MQGVHFTPLKIIEGASGHVYHGMRAEEPTFHGFGEAYFSSVNHLAVKGWKMHTRMTLNLIVVEGAIRFVLFDNRPDSLTKGDIQEWTLASPDYYGRLTIPPGIWVAFQGRGEARNLLLNIASIPHDPGEAESLPLSNDLIPFNAW